MLDRMAAGELPHKPHTQLRGAEGELRYEQCLTRAGFDGPFSMLYHQAPPQAWVALEEGPARAVPSEARESALLRRHYRTRLLPSGSTFYASRSELMA